ncbi:MAG: Rrf2 family transcriptional regulator [Chloroflexota bacterium]|nr:Rrf2 family transcriptional regulator [Chloroflexota bacterium]
MRVPTRTRYGIRAMVDIAIHRTEEPIHVNLLARRLEISKNYLENLMLILKRNGLVTSSRGPKGGYSLTRHPADIRLPEIFVALEGSETLFYCVDCPDDCPHSNHCASRDLLKSLGEAMISTLSSITLEKMTEWQIIKMEQET